MVCNKNNNFDKHKTHVFSPLPPTHSIFSIQITEIFLLHRSSLGLWVIWRYEIGIKIFFIICGSSTVIVAVIAIIETKAVHVVIFSLPRKTSQFTVKIYMHIIWTNKQKCPLHSASYRLLCNDTFKDTCTLLNPCLLSVTYTFPVQFCFEL